jgi:acyl-CoA synthetase (AMP-forming)/AMP-acid ligase II
VTYGELEGAQQPAGPSPARARAEAARPLRDLHGEQRPLCSRPAWPANAPGCTTPAVNSYLKADELAYILDNSESKLLITSRRKLAVAREALAMVPAHHAVPGRRRRRPRRRPTASSSTTPARWSPRFPTTPIADERLGTPMLYSSGTTGRPKGILRPLPDEHRRRNAAAAVRLS